MLLMLRLCVALLVLVAATLLVALPAAGLCLGVPARPATAPSERLAARPTGAVWTAGTGARQAVGAITWLKLAGTPEELGAAHGALVTDLVAGLEGDLVGTLVERVPSFAARHVLLGLVGFNNRHLVDQLLPEEQREIFAAVTAPDPALDPWRALGSQYQRAVHYHALHDVSQYLIDNPLVRPIQVGCSAFAAWGEHTPGGGMIVGRLFDFEGGPRFDLDKVVFTVAPKDGLRFIHVAWAGMTGAVTGFNEAGLWVSINAAATQGMGFSGRPIVMVVRQVLQHCRTIDEAVAVLRSSQVFVSDGVLLASRSERRAVVVELGPTGLAVRDSEAGLIRSTNHFLAPEWANDAPNRGRIEHGTTTTRYARLGELLAEQPIDAARAVAILRDHRGLGGTDLGFNNRSTINAWIGAHLAVADLERGILWVSEPRHGLGIMRAFTIDGPAPANDLPADAELARCEKDLVTWLALRDEVRHLIHAGDRGRLPALVATLLALNPHNFESHWLAGLAATDRQVRTEHLRQAVALQPAYSEDGALIRQSLEGSDSDLGPAERIP